jgi:hypothetical protein
MACIQPNVQTIISYMVPASEENRTYSDNLCLRVTALHDELSLNLAQKRLRKAYVFVSVAPKQDGHYRNGHHLTDLERERDPFTLLLN